MKGVFLPRLILPNFEPRRFLKTLSDYRCTASGGVPAVFTLLLQHMDLIRSLDFFMTDIMLRSNPKFVEANAVARFFLYGWGVKGLIYFKLGMVALVCVISQIVAQKRPRTAKWLLNWATLVVAGVVIYSLVLFLRHSDVSELLETW